MCNAWNHPPNCNCGWGGSNYVNPNVGRNKSLCATRIEPKTYTTPCPWCGQDVYYHTNGYGDSVYFDSLGYPWQIHGCFKDHLENKKTSKHQPPKKLTGNFFNKDISIQKRLILIGIAQQIKDIQVEAYFRYGLTIFGLKELMLAEAMDISLADLRLFYAHLYSINSNGISFLTNKEKRQKMLKLAKKIPNAHVGKFLIYNVTEDSFASEMSVTLEQFREAYGHLYAQESGGIKVFTEQEFE